MYVEEIHIEGFTCFRSASAKLLVPPAGKTQAMNNVTLTLGMNGAGKTSVLRSIALGVLGDLLMQGGLVPRYLVRRSEMNHATLRGKILLCAPQDSESTMSIRPETHIRRRGDHEIIAETLQSYPSAQMDALRKWKDELYRDDSPAGLILGYGATRRVDISEVVDPQAQRRQRSARYQRIAGLFEDHIALVPLHVWLPGSERRDEVIDLIGRLLPEGDEFRGEREGYQMAFRLRGSGPLPFSALSDGYRAYLALVGDILYHLAQVTPAGQALTEMTGVVLVDEIDLHLHPSWQRMVVPQLARTLPRLQFVLTSHSPLVVSTLRPENILLMEREEPSPDGWPSIKPRRLDESTFGLSADQLLASPYFGLPSSRAPEAERKRLELADRAAEGDDKAALEYVQSLIDGDVTASEGEDGQ
jgi:predicted ATP-binding protein involved in virulence